MSSRESPYAPELIEEMRAFNAGLTRAGQKQRPGSSRGHGITRGSSSGYQPGRPTRAPVFGSNPSRTVSNGLRGNQIIRRPSPTSHPVINPKRRPSRPHTPTGAHTWANTSSIPSSAEGGFPASASPATSQVSYANNWDSGTGKSASRAVDAPDTSPVAATNTWGAVTNRSASQVANAPDASQDASNNGWASSSSTQFCGFSHGVVTSAGGAEPQPVTCFPLLKREPIVTNWGPDSVGPQLASHLSQPSAQLAIMRISAETGIAYGELTINEHSILAPRNRCTSPQKYSSDATAVSPTYFMSAPDIDSNIFAMDIDSEPVRFEPRAANLQDSLQAEEQWNISSKKISALYPPLIPHSSSSYGPACNVDAAPTGTENAFLTENSIKGSRWAAQRFAGPSQQSNKWKSTTNTVAAVKPVSAANLASSSGQHGIVSPFGQTLNNFGNKTAHTEKSKEKTLKDSIWAS